MNQKDVNRKLAIFVALYGVQPTPNEFKQFLLAPIDYQPIDFYVRRKRMKLRKISLTRIVIKKII